MKYWPYSQATKTKFKIVRVRGYRPPHYGVDDAPTKDRYSKNIPLIASVNGRLRIGTDGYGGKWVLLYGDDGKQYFSLHLRRYASRIFKVMGKYGNILKPRVKQGSIIGYLGSTGLSTGPHIHFEVRTASGRRVDPDKQGLTYLKSKPKKTMVKLKIGKSGVAHIPIKVNVHVAIIRKKPTTNSPEVATAKMGDEFFPSLVDKGEKVDGNDTWYFIAQKKGWIAGRIVKNFTPKKKSILDIIKRK